MLTILNLNGFIDMWSDVFFLHLGILSKIQNDYKIDDAQGGALQTVFVLSYMVFAPMFGYLGDRHSRKLLMAFGVFLWTMFTLVGSFMPVSEIK